MDPAIPHQIMDYFLVSSSPFSAEYTVINENCPGAEWNIMCRECCEYDQIECVCPGQKERVGYTIPCCRNEENECDSCLIHPGMFVAVLCSHQIFGQGIMADARQGNGEQAHLTEAWDCPAFPSSGTSCHSAGSSKTLGKTPPKQVTSLAKKPQHFLLTVLSSGCLRQPWKLPKGDTIAGFTPGVLWWYSWLICIPKARKERQAPQARRKKKSER